MTEEAPAQPVSSFNEIPHRQAVPTRRELPGAPRTEWVLCLIALGAAVILDVLAAYRAPGLGAMLGILGVIGVICVLHGRLGLRLGSRNRFVIVALLAILASFYAVRTSHGLLALNTCVLILGFTMLALRLDGHRLRDARIRDMFLGGLEVAATSFLRSLVVLARSVRRSVGQAPDDATERSFFRRHARDILLGLLIAIPILGLFIALFAASDEGFRRLVADVFDLDVTSFVEHVWFIAWCLVLVLAALVSSLAAEAVAPMDETPRSWAGPAVIWIVLGSICLLFVSFLALQASYLFGGAEYLQEKAGLTAAEYARHGFYELIVVAGLTVVIVVAARSSFSERAGSITAYRILGPLLSALTIVVLGSAMARLLMYADRFGLTEQRISAVVILGWIAVVLAWIAIRAALLRPLAIGAFAGCAGLVLVIALNIANPQAIAARTIMDGRGVDGQRRIDVTYLTNLGTDAAPTIMSRLDHVPSVQRETISREVWKNAAYERQHARGWRSWNRSRERAWDVAQDPAKAL
jgi:hypothetical protein